jgi:hypothetical protein
MLIATTSSTASCYACSLWITRFILFYFRLKHVNCSFMYCCMLHFFSLNYALHTILLQYDTCLVQLRVVLLIVWLQLELCASYCSTSDWNMLIAECSWTRACYMSSVWATSFILYFNLKHTNVKFVWDFLAPTKKGHACHRGNWNLNIAPGSTDCLLVLG